MIQIKNRIRKGPEGAARQPEKRWKGSKQSSSAAASALRAKSSPLFSRSPSLPGLSQQQLLSEKTHRDDLHTVSKEQRSRALSRWPATRCRTSMGSESKSGGGGGASGGRGKDSWTTRARSRLRSRDSGEGKCEEEEERPMMRREREREGGRRGKRWCRREKRKGKKKMRALSERVSLDPERKLPTSRFWRWKEGLVARNKENGRFLPELAGPPIGLLRRRGSRPATAVLPAQGGENSKRRRRPFHLAANCEGRR